MIVYSQDTIINPVDTTISKEFYNKLLISFDNCGNEVLFYKSELDKCNFSDSLKTITYNKLLDNCKKENERLLEINKKNKLSNTLFGISVGVLFVTILKLII